MKFSSSIILLSATGAMAYGGSSGGSSGSNIAVVEIAAGGSGGSGGSAGCCGAAAAAPMSEAAMAASSSMAAPPMMAAASTTAAPMAMTTVAAAAAAMTHTVTVGGGTNLAYNPTAVAAAVGDTVLFMFMAKNHTVTQSTFDKPCNKMDGGQDSGFMPNMMDVAAGAPTFSFTVMATTPTWWYCRQKMPVVHCGKGMVFAVNPTADKSFATFQSQAIALNGTDTSSSVAAVAATTAVAAASSVTLSVDNGAAASTSAAAAAPPAAVSTQLAAGWNTAGNTGACSCACFCGVAAFPAGSLDGVGAFGGMAGALPAPW